MLYFYFDSLFSTFLWLIVSFDQKEKSFASSGRVGQERRMRKSRLPYMEVEIFSSRNSDLLGMKKMKVFQNIFDIFSLFFLNRKWLTHFNREFRVRLPRSSENSLSVDIFWRCAAQPTLFRKLMRLRNNRKRAPSRLPGVRRVLGTGGYQLLEFRGDCRENMGRPLEGVRGRVANFEKKSWAELSWAGQDFSLSWASWAGQKFLLSWASWADPFFWLSELSWAGLSWNFSWHFFLKEFDIYAYFFLFWQSSFSFEVKLRAAEAQK